MNDFLLSRHCIFPFVSTLFDQRFLCISISLFSSNVLLVRFDRKKRLLEGLNCKEYWLMYRQTWNVILESASELMLMSCFLPKQAWMKIFKSGGVRKAAVSYASRDHLWKDYRWLVFPLYAWVISWTGQSFLSPLSLSNQMEYCQFCGRNTRIKEKEGIC